MYTLFKVSQVEILYEIWNIFDLILDLLNSVFISRISFMSQELIVVPKYSEVFVHIFNDKIELNSIEFIKITIAFSIPRLVNLRRLLVDGKLQVMHQFRVWNIFNIKHVF